MISVLSRPLAAAAALGWALSVAVSLASLGGVKLPGWLDGAFFAGLFPLWICAILIAQRLTKGASQSDFWKAAWRGCPTWLRYAIWGSWGYTGLMFLLTIGANHEAGGIGFLGVFYASALGIFITADATRDEPTKCLNGHPIGPFDKFCRECGAEIKRNSAQLVS